MKITVVGTLDTKGEEEVYAKGLIKPHVHSAILSDGGSSQSPLVELDSFSEARITVIRSEEF